jgi:hypothetical protein
MIGRPNSADFGLASAAPERTTDVAKGEARSGTFVHRIFRLVPLTEEEQADYQSEGVLSNSQMPKFKEVLVSERYFEGIG